MKKAQLDNRLGLIFISEKSTELQLKLFKSGF